MKNDRPELANIPGTTRVTDECRIAISRELSAFMDAEGLTLVDVAGMSGMSYYWLYKQMRGKKPMTVNCFARIREFLDSADGHGMELPVLFQSDVAVHVRDFWQTLADHAMANPRMTMKSRLAGKGRFGVSLAQDAGQLEAGTVVVIDGADAMPEDGCAAVLFLADNSVMVGVYADGGGVVGVFREGMHIGEEPFTVTKDADGNRLVVAAYKVAGIVTPNGERTVSVPSDRISRWKSGSH